MFYVHLILFRFVIMWHPVCSSFYLFIYFLDLSHVDFTLLKMFLHTKTCRHVHVSIFCDLCFSYEFLAVSSAHVMSGEVLLSSFLLLSQPSCTCKYTGTHIAFHFCMGSSFIYLCLRWVMWPWTPYKLYFHPPRVQPTLSLRYCLVEIILCQICQ